MYIALYQKTDQMTQTTVDSHLIDHSVAVDFILAGNSVFTFKDLATNTRFTYKVKQCSKNECLFYVSVLTQPDNVNGYSILLDVCIKEQVPQVFHNKRYWVKETAPSFMFFKKYFYNLMFEMPMPNLEIWHEGRCCRCGRTLTVPESIVSGIGPECANKIKNWI